MAVLITIVCLFSMGTTIRGEAQAVLYPEQLDCKLVDQLALRNSLTDALRAWPATLECIQWAYLLAFLLISEGLDQL
jgi:hypothetical protein